MHTFLVTLHVVAAVFLIGPMAIAPMSGLRGIRQQDAGVTRAAARQTMLYALLSLLVFGLGVAVVPTGHDYTFGTAWITISMTLYLIVLLVTTLVVAPSLGQAVKLLTSGSSVDTSVAAGATDVGRDVADAVTPGSPERPAPTDPGGSPPTAPLDDPATAGRPALSADALRKLDAVRGRVAVTSGICALLLLVITVLMVVKPFT